MYEPEPLFFNLNLVWLPGQTFSELYQIKKTGIIEDFARSYHLEARAGWGNGGHQIYHLGYLGKRDVEKGSVLHYGAEVGINTSRLPPDDLRYRYFSVRTNWLRQFSLVTQGGYSDYRQAINAWEWPYTRKVRCIGLANHFTYDLGGEYYITVPSDFERIDLDDRSEVTENRFRIAPRLEADFSSFLSAAGIKFELSSEYFLFGPNVEYVRWYPQPDFYLNQITLRFGYVYIDDRARQNFLFPEARLDFFDGKISVDVGRGYRVYDWINEFKESRLTARENILPSPADSSVIEKDLIRIGSDLRIHPAQITIRTEFRRVDQPFYWTKDFGEILVYHTRVPKDVNILSAAVSWEKRSGWLQGRYIVASEDLPGLYRLEMSGGANYSFDPVADLDCDFKFFLLPYIAGDDKSILICDAGIERNILNLFTASFEVKNIFDQEYIIWPNLETGRQFLFQIKTQI